MHSKTRPQFHKKMKSILPTSFEIHSRHIREFMLNPLKIDAL